MLTGDKAALDVCGLAVFPAVEFAEVRRWNKFDGTDCLRVGVGRSGEAGRLEFLLPRLEKGLPPVADWKSPPKASPISAVGLGGSGLMHPSCEVAGRSVIRCELAIPSRVSDEDSSTEEASPSSIGDSKRGPVLEVDADAEPLLYIDLAFEARESLDSGRLGPVAAVEVLFRPSSCESLDCR